MTDSFINLEGVSLNATRFSSMTEDEFSAAAEPHWWNDFSEADRKQLIKMAFGLIHQLKLASST